MIHLHHQVLCTLLLLLTAGWTSTASASECQHGDASLAGHYFLRGMMEVGSELRLQANGKFDYMPAYGALDELASGCWSRKGQTVTLVVSKFKANREDPVKFARLVLEVKADGKLLRRFDGGDTGAYSR